LIARPSVLMSLGEPRHNRFPSVLLQPLGHLSVSLESAIYGLVAQPETQIV
jgi:hypothetical protein